jgi:putative ABC transport system permease protein
MVALGVFAALALALSALGIYGVLSYTVSQRTFELGVRIALGAERAGVFLLVLRRAAVLVSIGAAIGLIGTLAMRRVMEGMLFGVTPSDPVTLGGVTLILTVVAVLACLAPIRRALRVDPIEALRSE